jgi:hypothetical protein
MCCESEHIKYPAEILNKYKYQHSNILPASPCQTALPPTQEQQQNVVVEHKLYLLDYFTA